MQAALVVLYLFFGVLGYLGYVGFHFFKKAHPREYLLPGYLWIVPLWPLCIVVAIMMAIDKSYNKLYKRLESRAK